MHLTQKNYPIGSAKPSTVMTEKTSVEPYPPLRLEKNVPLPEVRRGGRTFKYPEHYELLGNMEVGDSILFPLDHCKQNSVKNKRVNSFIGTAKKKFKYKLSLRKLGATVRVWRIE